MDDPHWRTALNPRVAWLQLRLDEAEKRIPNEHQNVDDWGYYSCPAGKPEGYGRDECECGLDERRQAALADLESKRRMLRWCNRLDPGDGLGGLMSSDARKVESWLAMPYAGREGYAELWPQGPYVER